MKKLLTILLSACICSPVLASPYPYSPYGPAAQPRAWYHANPGARNQYPMTRPGYNPWSGRNVQLPQYRPMQPQRQQVMGDPRYNRWSAPANRGWGQNANRYQAQRNMSVPANQGYLNQRPVYPQMAYRNMRPNTYSQYRQPQNSQWQARQPYARPYAQSNSRMVPRQPAYPRMAQPWPMYPRVAQRNYPAAFNPNVPSQYQARMMPRNMYAPYRRAAMAPPVAYRQMQAYPNFNAQRAQASSNKWNWPRQNVAAGQMPKPYGYQAPQRNYQQYPAGWNSRKVSYTK